MLHEDHEGVNILQLHVINVLATKLLVILVAIEAEFVGPAASSGNGHHILTLARVQSQVFLTLCIYANK